MAANAARIKETTMDKCVYCGRDLPENPPTIKVKETDFEVCGEACKQAGEKYLARDKKLKLPLYLIILAAAVVIILTAVTRASMVGANVMQIVVGLAFILLPYPIANFTTFQSVPVRRVVLITRIIGVVLALWGIVVLVGALV